MTLTHEALDYASYGVTLATLTNFLPPIAAAFAIIWTLIRIYEWVRFRFFNKKDSYVFVTPEERLRDK